jgi:hypothetical protein
MARHTPGNYVPLDVNYPHDAAIRAAGEAAELLYVRALAYCKRVKTDGFVPSYDLPVVSIGMRSVPRRVAALVKHGLWTEEAGGYRVKAWGKWNKPVTSQEAFIEGQSEAGSRGNHERWHAKRGVVEPSCTWCNPNRVADRVAESDPNRTPESPIREGKGREKGDGDRKDVQDLCDHLRRRVVANGSRVNITTKWREAARLLIDRDQRSLDEAHALIDWCQDSEFWRSNILSLPKFREQYDKLRLQAKTRGLHVVTDPSGARTWSAAELDAVLGPDLWTCPQPPRDLDADQMWEWEQRVKREHRAERIRQAEAKTGRTA